MWNKSRCSLTTLFFLSKFIYFHFNQLNFLLRDSSCGCTLNKCSDCTRPRNPPIILIPTLLQLLLLIWWHWLPTSLVNQLISRGCSSHLRLHQTCLGIILIRATEIGLLFIGEHFLVVNVNLHPILELLLLLRGFHAADDAGSSRVSGIVGRALIRFVLRVRVSSLRALVVPGHLSARIV